MSKISVQQITITDPITVVGKEFTGDYGDSSKYILEVQSELKKKSIGFAPNKVLGVYFDNPYEKKPQELRSFQAVFPEPGYENALPESMSVFKLRGRFLYTKVIGDPAKVIVDGYNALFSYMKENGITSATGAASQISTFEEGVITTEIYIALG